MFRLSATLRIALGLACLGLSVFLASRTLGLGQDECLTRAQGRAALCETVALHVSTQLEHGSQDELTENLEQLVNNNRDIESIRIRLGDHVVIRAGDHEAYLKKKDSESESQACVPVFQGTKVIGNIEMCFADTYPSGVFEILASPEILQLVFVLAACTLFYSLYLSKMLDHLDPSKVIPDRVRAALDTFAEGLFVLDSNESIVLANAALVKTVGIDNADLQGRKAESLDWDTRGNEYPWTAALREGQPKLGEMVDLVVNQRRISYMVNASPILSEKGRIQGVLASFDDVTVQEQRKRELEQTLHILGESREQIRRQNRELRQLATRDPLTGCMNRRAFFDKVEKRWANARVSDASLSFVMVDVDNFKFVNDTYGHSTGDTVLKELGKLLLKLEAGGVTVCRFGGEEFCLIMEEKSLEATREFAEEMRSLVKAQRPAGLGLTVSIGVAVGEPAAMDMQVAIDQADRSLYVAKMLGRDRVICFGDFTEEEFQQLMTKKLAPVDDNDSTVSGIPFNALTGLISALSYRDASTAEHSRRVADLCAYVSLRLLSFQDQFVLETAALLHDIGKIGTPDAVLLKPGPLDLEEREVMSLSDFIGIEIVKSTFDNPELVNILAHRYAWYGGHPSGAETLTGEDIPLGSRILSICDAYDAIVTDLVYRKRATPEAAFEELRRFAGTQFDPQLVEEIISRIQQRDLDTEDGDDVEISKRTAKEIGVLMSQISEALELGDRKRLHKQAQTLGKTAVDSNLASISEIAQALTELTSREDDDDDLVAETARTLLDLCRITQRVSVEVCEESRRRREELARRVFHVV